MQEWTQRCRKVHTFSDDTPQVCLWSWD